MNQKLIFLDVDGTLTPLGGQDPPESALRAVREARKMGHKVFLCSGRNYGMMKPLLKYGFDGGITSCGGHIFAGDDVLQDCPWTENQKNRAFELLSKEGVMLSIEAKDVSYGDDRPKQILMHGSGRGQHLLDMIKAVWIDLGPLPLEEYDGRPLYKMVFICESLDQLEPAKRELGDELMFIVHDFSEKDCHFGEIISRKYNKGIAVRIVADALGYDMADTIGFGDSNIDIEMIETVGTGACMEDGSPLLKERSDLICPPCNEDGIEWGFKRLGLI